MTDSASVHCTLTPADLRDRRSQARATLVPHVVSTTPLTDGLRVDFRTSETLRGQIKEFMALEQECCGFLRFTLSKPADGLYMLIQGPPEAADVIEMFRQTVKRQ